MTARGGHSRLAGSVNPRRMGDVAAVGSEEPDPDRAAEGVHESAARLLDAGYVNIETLARRPDRETLRRLLADAHIVGIRSQTRLTAAVLEAAPRLFCVGCFCIGTNQVDVDAAKRKGVPVFNAPYSNTRSVAELVVGEIIMLLRRVPEKSALAHAGVWRKTAAGAHEVRGKVLGIVGYGHIGSQLSVLAEAIGMRVRFFDIVDKLSLGNAEPCASLAELLDDGRRRQPARSRHAGDARHDRRPRDRPDAAGRAADQRRPRHGRRHRRAGRGDPRAAGSPVPPSTSSRASRPDADEPLETPLRRLPNVILTPHVGGSTVEAQANIGSEVAEKLVKYSDNGSTIGAVNFVEVALPVQRGVTRFLHIHRNVPGVLMRVNEVFSAGA